MESYIFPKLFSFGIKTKIVQACTQLLTFLVEFSWSLKIGSLQNYLKAKKKNIENSCSAWIKFFVMLLFLIDKEKQC